MTDENVQIACHKLLLSAASNYFRAMFTTAGMREADSACAKVPVHGVRAEVLQRLVQSAYTGEVTIEERTVCELLAAATMLQFQHVCDAGSQFLEQHMDHTNCLSIAEFASDNGFSALYARTRAYLARHFAQVAAESDEFLKLSPEALRQLLARDDLFVRGERQVCSLFTALVNCDLVITDHCSASRCSRRSCAGRAPTCPTGGT